MDPMGTPQSVGSSISRAKELTGELRRLQEHVESLDASGLHENVQKVRHQAVHALLLQLTALASRTCVQKVINPCSTPVQNWVCFVGMPAPLLQLQEQVARITEKLQTTLTKLGSVDVSATGSGSSVAPTGSSQQQAGGSAAAPRGKIDKMSAEVVDSNPYSRLMALQRMGIVKDYERIRDKTVGVQQNSCTSTPIDAVVHHCCAHYAGQQDRLCSMQFTQRAPLASSA
jgi:ubiquitin-like modifier-activating enzyme 5